MKIRRRVYQCISEAMSVAGNVIPDRTGLRILMYHSIGGKAVGDTEGMFSVSKRDFQRQIEYLAQIKTVSLNNLVIKNDLLQVAVTFDDGYQDNLTIAAPILVEHGIPFTVYVSSNFVKENVKGFLNTQELKELAELPGVTIGSHGVTHERLTSCSDAMLESELVDSKNYLEDVIGSSVASIAYPHGSVNSRVIAKVKDANYELGVCSQFDINHCEDNPLMLSRTAIFNDDNDRIFEEKLSGNWDWYRFRNLPNWLEKIKYKHL